MEKLSTEQQNTNVSYKNKNVKTQPQHDSISLRYMDISERIQKLGVAFMMLSDTLSYPQSQLSTEFDIIGMSLIRDCVFYDSMSYTDEENVLYAVVRALDTADRFMRALYALSKISPMNFILIHKELVSNKSRVATQLEYLRTKRGNAGLYSSLKFSDQKLITEKLEELLLVKNDEGKSMAYEYPDNDEGVKYGYNESTSALKKSQKQKSTLDPDKKIMKSEKPLSDEIQNLIPHANLAVDIPKGKSEQVIDGKHDLAERTITPALILRRQVITDLIKTRGAVTMVELHNDLPDVNRKTLSRDLIDLTTDGIISAARNGRWTVYRIV